MVSCCFCCCCLSLPTVLDGEVNAIGTERPSTLNLGMCMEHDPSLSGTVGQDHKSRSKVAVRVSDNRRDNTTIAITQQNASYRHTTLEGYLMMSSLPHLSQHFAEN